MAENLDIDQPIVLVDPDTKEYKATPYFEDYLFQLVEDLGGEGSTSSANDALDLSTMLLPLLGMPPKIDGNEKDIDDLEQVTAMVQPLFSLVPKVDCNEKNIEELEQLVASLTSENSLLRSIISRFKFLKSETIAAGGTTFTTTTDQDITCLNTAAATVTLNTNPVDGEEVIVARREALVTISGAIDGDTSLVIVFQFDTPHLRFSLAAGEWGLV